MEETIYERFIRLGEEKKRIEKELLDVQVELYKAHFAQLSGIEEGTVNVNINNEFKLKVTKKNTVTVDQAMAEAIGLGFSKKYSFSKTAYNKLTEQEKKLVNEAISTKPAKPSFAIERMK